MDAREYKVYKKSQNNNLMEIVPVYAHKCEIMPAETAVFSFGGNVIKAFRQWEDIQ